MRTFHKKIVTDDTLRPIAVQIDYPDWLEIERLLGLVPNGTPSGLPRADPARFAGILDLPIDPLEYQRQVRGEWS